MCNMGGEDRVPAAEQQATLTTETPQSHTLTALSATPDTL